VAIVISHTFPAVTVRPFGRLPDGTRVDLYSLVGERIVLHVITYGGIIPSLELPDRYGITSDVVLGHDSLYIWSASPISSPDGAGVIFTRTSPAGKEHYPGTVGLRYEATTDAPIVNLTKIRTSAVAARRARAARARSRVRSLRGPLSRNTALPRRAQSRALPPMELRPRERYRSITRWEFTTD
jgi:hypothetical protein